MGPHILASAGWPEIARAAAAALAIKDAVSFLFEPLLLTGAIYLVERRGRGGRLDPRRHLEISTLLESVPEAVFIFDAEARILDLNQAAEQLCACPRDQLRRFDLRALAGRLNPQLDDKPLEFDQWAVARALRGEQVRNQRLVLRHPETGNNIEALVSANPMRNQDGQLLGVLAIFSDVTELTDLQRRIVEVERHVAVGQMAAGMAHDFNNVLDTIAQAVAILELHDHEPPAKRKQYLDMIRNGVRRGAEIIAQVRNYLRRGTSKPTDVDLQQLLDEVIELTRPLWQVSKGLQFSRELKPVSPIRANAADLRRVFTNLIINAIEAMPNGGELKVGCEEQGGFVVAYVADTGQGIAPDQQKKIFLPYFTTKPGGTGLGLSGAQRIVLSLGGSISFSSHLGRGTRFDVRLPARKAQDSQRAA